ncbi:MAG: hypothetical protein ABIR26_08375, partial [Ramlibacter sp.]
HEFHLGHCSISPDWNQAAGRQLTPEAEGHGFGFIFVSLPISKLADRELLPGRKSIVEPAKHAISSVM